MKVQLGQQARDLRLVDFHGDAIQLSSLWAKTPVMLFFHRHLGCLFARQAFKRLDCSAGQLETHGIRIVSIVPTTASNACEFCTEGDYWHTCLADPKLESYRAYGVPKATVFQMFSLKPMQAARDAVRRGYKVSSRIIGHALVMPAVVVINKHGAICGVRYSEHIGDIPSVNELIALASCVQASPAT